MPLQERVDLLDMCCRLRSAAAVARYFKINESNVRPLPPTIKEINEVITTATPVVEKNLALFMKYLFIFIENVAFMGVQGYNKKDIPTD